jgi:7-cyano-7-deazaguanine reductase
MADMHDHDDLTLLGAGERNYPTSPDEARLETFANAYAGRAYTIRFTCPEFTALCPVTGQPDFGTLVIEYQPADRCLESKSLKLYLFAYRNHGTFHEEVVNRVLDDCVAACRPHWLRVTGDFHARGGIALHVVADYPSERDGSGAHVSS